MSQRKKMMVDSSKKYLISSLITSNPSISYISSITFKSLLSPLYKRGLPAPTYRRDRRVILLLFIPKQSDAVVASKHLAGSNEAISSRVIYFSSDVTSEEIKRDLLYLQSLLCLIICSSKACFALSHCLPAVRQVKLLSR